MTGMIRMAAALVLGVSAALAEEPAKEPAKELDARGAVEAFLSAALGGRAKEAAALGQPDTVWTNAEKIAADFAPYQGKAFPLHCLQADDAAAMAITGKIAGDDKPDRLVVYLTKKSGSWRVGKIDVIKKEEGVQRRQETFLKGYPKAAFLVGKAEEK